MREVRIKDTLSGELAARCRPGPAARSGSTPVGRPPTARSTSATRGRSSSSRCCAASSRTRATAPSLVINLTDVNDKIYDAAGERGVSLLRARRGDDRRLHGRYRPARPRPPRSRAEGDRDDRRDHRADLRRWSRPGTPTSPEATSTSGFAATPATGRSRTVIPTRWIRARRRARSSSRRTRSTSRSGRPPRRARTPPGPAPGARGAPAGTSSARRWPRSCSALEFAIHGGGSDLVFPHHENEAAQTEAARGRPLARLWMHNGMVETGPDEKMAKSVGNIFLLGEALDAYGREAVVDVPDLGPLPAAAAVQRRCPRAGARPGTSGFATSSAPPSAPTPSPTSS